MISGHIKGIGTLETEYPGYGVGEGEEAGTVTFLTVYDWRGADRRREKKGKINKTQRMIFSFHTSSKQQQESTVLRKASLPFPRYLLLGQQQILVSIGP